MKIKQLTTKELLSVPCPTCGAANGKPCELHAGGQRNEPHTNRKFAAAEAVEMKRIYKANGRIVPVRFNHDDLQAMIAAAVVAKQTLSGWIRSTLNAALHG
jgi:hypothetical protein